MATYKEMATNLRNSVITDFPGEYKIVDELKQGLTDADIRSGIKAFSDLLIRLFDVLAQNPDADETLDRSKVKTTIHTDIRNSLILLYGIGLCGSYNSKSESIIVDGSALNKIFRKKYGSKPERYLKLLRDAGLTFSVDISEKSFNLTKAKDLIVQYPDAKYTLAGLKAMAQAAAKYNDNIIMIFARCDYNALEMPKKLILNIHEVAKFLPNMFKQYFIDLHNLLISSNCKHETKNSMEDCVFLYDSKTHKARIFSIRISLSGLYVKMNSKLITTQENMLSDAPAIIKEAVVKSHNCVKAVDPDACNPNCKGKLYQFFLDGTEYTKCRHLCFYLPVDNTAEREYIMEWLQKELVKVGIA